MFKRLLSLALLLPAIIIAGGVGLSPFGTWFDAQTYRLTAYQSPSENSKQSPVLLVDLDAESLKQFGQWPISRGVHAEVINRLTALGATAVVYNLAFITPDLSPDSADSQLLAALKKNGRVVLPFVAEEHRELMPLNLASIEGVRYAHPDLSIEEDGVLRRVYLYAGIGFPQWPSIAVATLMTYAPVKVGRFAGLRTPYLHVGFSDRWSRDYEQLLPFGIERFVQQTERVTLSQLLEGEVSVTQVKHKAVFVGISDPLLEKPLQLANQQHYSSTEIQAFIFDRLNSDAMLAPSLPVWSVALAVIVVLCVGGAWLLAPSIWWAILPVSLGMALAALPFLLLMIGIWVNVTPTIVAVTVLLMTVLLRSSWQKFKTQKSPD